jgi:predicted nucleic acid-binding protein
VIVVADASVLVGELLRRRGRELLAHPSLRVFVAAAQWEETNHELDRRLQILLDRGKLTLEQSRDLREALEEMLARRVIEVVAPEVYAANEEAARRRVPRDPDDWPMVALAMTLGCGILTGDGDLLGCGCPTWTVQTLRAELDAGG